MRCQSQEIHTVSKLALSFSKMIFLGGVSESKVKRAKNISSSEENRYPLELLSISQKEAKALFKDYNSDENYLNICKQAKAKNVVITLTLTPFLTP